MQLRKLIRLLNEMKEIYGDRIECCIDSKFSDTCKTSDIRFISIPDVEAQYCTWNIESTENPQERTILVLGNY